MFYTSITTHAMKAILVENDNVYFTDGTDTTIVCVLYDNVYETSDGRLIHSAKDVRSSDEYSNTKDNIQTHQAKYLRDMSSSELSELCECLKRTTQTPSVDWGCSMGRTYIKVHNDDIQSAPRIIQSLLDLGFRLYMNDGSQLTISLDIVNGVYNQENREKAILKYYRDILNEGYWNTIKECISYSWKCAGRVKLPELKQFLLEHFPNENTQDNGWNDFDWNKSSNSNESEKETQSEDVHVQSEDDNDNDNLCVVCLVNQRETFVEPCEHIVVCEQCSEQLSQDRSGNIKDRCVYCRRDISYISYLISNKKVKVHE